MEEKTLKRQFPLKFKTQVLEQVTEGKLLKALCWIRNELKKQLETNKKDSDSEYF